MPPKLFARDMVKAYEMMAMIKISESSDPSTSLNMVGMLMGGIPIVGDRQETQTWTINVLRIREKG